MKNFLNLALFIVFSVKAFGQHPVVNEKVVNIEATKISDVLNFSLLIQNEASDYYYMLVKKHQDGSYELVKFKSGIANKINQPLLYSFKENDVPKDDVGYVLIKSSYDDSYSQVLGSWHYDSVRETIEKREDEDFAESFLINATDVN